MTALVMILFVVLLCLAVPVGITVAVGSMLPSLLSSTVTVSGVYVLRAMVGGVNQTTLLAIIDEAAAIARDYAREQAVERADQRIETINNSGACQVVSISDELWEDMQEQSQDLYEEIRGVVDDDELFFAYVGDAYEGE
ncbi:MAG: hypothetical protein LUG64_04870 [Clostridiales bacterium]|nr:hypothetical protein [Clostridiales bacterium]